MATFNLDTMRNTKRKSKKLMIIYNDLGLGGVQRKIVDIANFSVSRQVFSDVAIMVKSGGGFFSPLINRQVKIIDLRLPRLIVIKQLLYYFKLVIVILKEKPDIILSFSSDVLIVKLLLFRRKIKFHINANDLFSVRNKLSRLSFFRKIIGSFLFTVADEISAVNIPVKKDIAIFFHLNPEIIKIFPNWVSIPRNITKSIAPIYDIIYIGRLDREKNLYFLLEIFKKILNKFPLALLCIVGNGNEKHNLLNKVRDLKIENNVVFYPATINFWRFLQKSKVLLITSINEGASLIILQALGIGIPCIALDIPPMRNYKLQGLHIDLTKSLKGFKRAIENILVGRVNNDEMLKDSQNLIKEKYSMDNLEDFVSELATNC